MGRGGRVSARFMGVVVLVTTMAATIGLTGSPASAAFVDDIVRVTAGFEVSDLARGDDGNVWVASSSNDTIARVTIGGLAAPFTHAGVDEPNAITAGPDGNLWFTNRGSGAIGRITTAGSVTIFPDDPNGLPEDIVAGPDGNLWYTSSWGWSINRITPAGVITSFDTGLTVAPYGIAAGSDGNLWFTSQAGDAVGKVTTAGAITVYPPSASLDAPTDITRGPDGNLWVVNDDASVARVTTAGAVTAFPAAGAGDLQGIAWASDGNLWTTDPSAGLVRRMTTSGSFTAFAASSAMSGDGAIIVGPDGSLRFGGVGRLLAMNLSGVSITAARSAVDVPKGMVTGPDGRVWSTNWGSDSITRTEPDGHTLTFADPSIHRPWGITPGWDNNLWFTNSAGSSISRIEPASGGVTTFPISGGAEPLGITRGSDGNVWFTDPVADLIGKVTPDGVVTTYSGQGINGPWGITAGQDGNLWFTNAGSNTLGKITTAGMVTLFSAPSGEVNMPLGITSGPDGALWFVNRLGTIGRFFPGGSMGGHFSTYTVGGQMFEGQIVTGGDGALWFTRYNGDAIGRITTQGTVTSHADPDTISPSAIAPGPDGNIWFGTATGTIGKVVLTRTTPDAPPSVSATGGYSSATVSWSPPNYNGGSPITGYTVTSNPGSKTCETNGELTCVVGGLTNGTAYTFTVKATNAQGDSTASPPSASITLFKGATFHPVTPRRLLDSRGSIGGWNGKLTAGTPRPLGVASGGLGVPFSATAAVLNVTVVESDSASFLTVYPNQPFPTSPPPPNASNLNFAAGEIVPNLVTVKLGTLGAVLISTANGSTHVVVDLVGYYDDGNGAGGLFTPITPQRMLDSRGSNGGWAGKLPAGPTNARDLQVRKPGNANGVPADATAVIANVTVTEADAQSFLKVWPSGFNPPDVSNVNFVPGQNVPNLVTIGIGSNGAIRFANAVGSVHVIVDVVGYFSPSSGTRFFGIDPTRVLDTRVNNGLSGPFAPQQVRTLQVTGDGSKIPVGATGLVANVTAVEGSAESLLTVYPGDASMPTSSNLNFVKSQIVPNLVTVGLSPAGTAKIYNDQGTVDVVADAVGFFAA